MGAYQAESLRRGTARRGVLVRNIIAPQPYHTGLATHSQQGEALLLTCIRQPHVAATQEPIPIWVGQHTCCLLVSATWQLNKAGLGLSFMVEAKRLLR